jgi:hypothetical protein
MKTTMFDQDFSGSPEGAPDNLCKVVFGCAASGWRDVTGPMTHEDCVNYLREHRDQDHFDAKADMHYIDSLDIMYVSNGRMASYVL